MTDWNVDFDVPTLLLGALIVVVVVSVIVAMSTSGSAFGVYNRDWEGTTELRSIAHETGAETTILTNTSQYDSAQPGETIAVILSPEAPYTPRQISSIKRFLDAGGTLLLAEDFGPHSNPLLTELGVTARFDGRLLRDARNHHRSSALPIARNVSNHPRVRGVEEITLNYGTAVIPNDGRILVTTSEFGYVDANSNGQLDDDESLNPFPVLVTERVGNGQILLLGDPSVLINVMLDRPGNRALLVALLSDYEWVLLDYSHSGQLPPLAVALTALRGSPFAQIILGLIVIGVFAVVEGFSSRSIPLDRSSPEDDGTASHRRQRMITYLEYRHPHWEEERIRRVVNSVLRNRDQFDNND